MGCCGNTSLDARRSEVRRLLSNVTSWAGRQANVDGLVLVGSYARAQERLGSDVDIVVLLSDISAYPAISSQLHEIRDGSRLVRSATWGPVREQRYRLRSGLIVEFGVAPASWADVPLDPGTRRVLSDGHDILFDPKGLLTRAHDAVAPHPTRNLRDG